MGRQINFWMTAEDELDFVERLRQDDAVWTPDWIDLGAAPQIHEFDDWVPLDDRQRSIVIRRVDWSRLEWEDIPKSRYPDSPQFFAHTSVGTGASPAFEWDFCHRTPGTIKRGRIYFRTDWLQDGEVRVKADEPHRWFDRLVAWLRRRGTKYEYPRQYLMPGAVAAGETQEISFTLP